MPDADASVGEVETVEGEVDPAELPAAGAEPVGDPLNGLDGVADSELCGVSAAPGGAGTLVPPMAPTPVEGISPLAPNPPDARAAAPVPVVAVGFGVGVAPVLKPGLFAAISKMLGW